MVVVFTQSTAQHLHQDGADQAVHTRLTTDLSTDFTFYHEMWPTAAVERNESWLVPRPSWRRFVTTAGFVLQLKFSL